MIPVCVPTLGKAEREYATECLKTNWISSQGEFVDKFEDYFAAYCGTEHGISTTSGTTALHLALAAIGVGDGDEVIIPSFTMAATAFAVAYCGATPVLVDSKPETWNLDTDQLAEKVTNDTKAILPVHIYGHPCDMDPILDIATDHELYVVEDAAEAHGAEYRGTKAGGIGHVGCFSFYANKMITTGEGGMVVTNDDEIAERAAWLKDLAYSADRRFVHPEIGYNYRMTNVQAAIGLGQAEQLDKLVQMRRENARLYDERLRGVEGLRLPPEKPWAKSNYWMYGVLVKDSFGLDRDTLMEELVKRGVETRRFFVPMHDQPVFRKMGLYEEERYPVADKLAERGLYLPSSSGLTLEEIESVCNAVRTVKESH